MKVNFSELATEKEQDTEDENPNNDNTSKKGDDAHGKTCLDSPESRPPSGLLDISGDNKPNTPDPSKNDDHPQTNTEGDSNTLFILLGLGSVIAIVTIGGRFYIQKYGSSESEKKQL